MYLFVHVFALFKGNKKMENSIDLTNKCSIEDEFLSEINA